MKKAILVALATGVVVTTVGITAEAKTPTTHNFYLHWDDEAGDCSGPTTVDLKDRADSGNGCGYTLQRTGANEVLGAAGQPYLERAYPSLQGTSFVLNAAKPITGVFQVNGWAHPVQAGNAVLDVEVTGTTGGKNVALASFSTTYTVTPAGGNVIEFSAKPPKKLHGKKFTSLTVTTNMHGIAVGQHYIDLEGPNAARVSIPAYK